MYNYFNMRKKYLLTISAIGLSVLLSGCTFNLGFGGGSTGPDGGIYKTVNKGETWQPKSLIPTVSGKPNLINSLDANVLAMDPGDPRALYYGTLENGLYYSYDGADAWFPVTGLNRTTINAVAVDPFNKCVIYAAIENKLMKSSDCSRTWQQTYYDNALDVWVSSIAIDHYDSHNVFIGTSRGEVIGSSDYGKSWRTLGRLNDKVRKVVVNPADSRIMYAATERKSLFRSTDKGETWVSLEDALKEFPDSGRFRDLYVSKVQPGLVILATNYGLIKSINSGDDWTALKLITPEKDATINAVVISEKNPREIYYVTNTTFYGTNDGGDNWTTKKLPSARAGWNLVADPNDAAIMYLSVKQIKE
jgi:photosystem II stability/assembly factor-like uncharacterized protein